MKSGKPDRYGEVTIKNITYFIFYGDGKERTLLINFYPTSSAFDVKLKGSIPVSSLKFKDKGDKTAGAFFIQDILPVFMKKLRQDHDIEKSKKYWISLAKKGYEHEKNKETLLTRSKVSKCDQCKKPNGKKPTLECHICKKLSMTECLSNIEETRMKRYSSNQEEFTCDKCIYHVDVETLRVNPDENDQYITHKEI